MMILYKVFGSVECIWQGILYALIILTITIGNLFAIRQQNLKRFLAFSSISQAGYIMLGVISNTGLGLTSELLCIGLYLLQSCCFRSDIGY